MWCSAAVISKDVWLCVSVSVQAFTIAVLSVCRRMSYVQTVRCLLLFRSASMGTCILQHIQRFMYMRIHFEDINKRPFHHWFHQHCCGGFLSLALYRECSYAHLRMNPVVRTKIFWARVEGKCAPTSPFCGLLVCHLNLFPSLHLMADFHNGLNMESPACGTCCFACTTNIKRP